MQIRSLSIVLPIYNEEDNVREVIKEISSTLNTLIDDFEIIAVNDGSIDRTGEILENLKFHDAHLKVVQHLKNQGYGAALVSGFKIAKKEFILMMDADRQFNISEITKLVPYIETFDIVAGFRIRRKDPLYRYFLGKCFNFIIRLLFKIKLKDINCGFKLFRTETLHNMHLKIRGALINTEIMALAYKNKASIKEIGVNHHSRLYGKASGGSLKVISKSMWELLCLRWSLFLC